METQSVAQNLRYQRKLKGFTQTTLSEKSEVTVRTIQRIEKGDVNPQLQTVKLLANALEIDIEDLLVLDNPKEETLHKKWLLFIHGSPLLGFVFPFSVLFPLFLWLHKREDNPIYNTHGIKVINFQLSMTILYVLALVSLVTIEGWGFFFFMAVIPFNFLVILYNIFKAISTQTCYYPLSISFLKIPATKVSNPSSTLLVIPLIVTLGCSSSQKNSAFESLLDYEGQYEYVDSTTLTLVASELDTTLYAVIDDAKYPLARIAQDSFTNIQGTPITFSRDHSNKVVDYQTDGQIFKLISVDIEKIEMLPRRALFHNPDGYQYQQPPKIDDGLNTGPLDEAFKNPEPILDMIQKTVAGHFPDVHSILIYKHDKLVLEEYFYGYDRNTPHQLRSATKSFIGGLVGIASDQGFIKSAKEKILPYFSSRYSEIDNLDGRKKQQTIEHFLTYRHGLDCEDGNSESEGNETSMMQSQDWVKNTLDLPMVDEPGKTSSYCTGCALALCSLVEIATGQNIESFAKTNLFSPLGITNYDWTFEPNQTSLTTFSQMYITPRDLMKLAKLYRDGGRWKNQQVISEEWVKKTFTMNDGEYGYLWYKKYFDIDGKRHISFQASGNGGQKINIWPKLDMITVFTGGNYNSFLLHGKSTPPNEMMSDYVLRAD